MKFFRFQLVNVQAGGKQWEAQIVYFSTNKNYRIVVEYEQLTALLQ